MLISRVDVLVFTADISEQDLLDCGLVVKPNYTEEELRTLFGKHGWDDFEVKWEGQYSVVAE